jgi:hypothetical protein
MTKAYDNMVLSILIEIREELNKHSAAFDGIETRFDRFIRRLDVSLKEMRAVVRISW